MSEKRAEEFERSVRTHQSALYRVAYRLTGNRDDAEDLLTEALTEAWSAFDRFQTEDGFVRLGRHHHDPHLSGLEAEGEPNRLGFAGQPDARRG